MYTLIERNKREKIFAVILTVLLFAFIGLVFYVNLSCNPEYYDGDMYGDISYIREAWKARSLFPKDWLFGNQTYVVATPALAVGIYGIMHNAILAMGIASCIMTVLIVLTYDWMTKPIFSYNERMSGFLFLVGVLLLKAHVATSQNGLQAFFTMASYYACYLINAFIVKGCYVRIRQGSFGKKHIPMIVIGAALSFGTGMQSLRQTAVMALPLAVCEIIFIIIFSVKNKKFAVTSSTAFSALIFVSNIAGVIAIKFVELNQDSIYGSTNLVKSLLLIFKRVITNLKYIMLTFGLDSLPLSARLAASVPFLLIIVAGIIFCTKDFFKKGCNDKGEFTLMLLTALGCASVFVVGVFIEIEPRMLYYFMIYPLLAMCVSYILVKFKKVRNIGIAVVSVFAVIMIAFRTVGTVGEVRKGTDENSTAHQIANYMLNNGYDTVYSVYGLSGSFLGAENVIVASNDSIYLVQYSKITGDKPLQPVEFLCVKDAYKSRDNDKSLYLLREYELPKVRELAEKYGVTMTLVEQFDDIYLYSMSENLCAMTVNDSEK